jgi:glycosyltransferase involved in cell wall biosynthesis
VILCAPHLGLRAESDLGGEVYERAILTRLAMLGDSVRLLVPPEADVEPVAPGWLVERWRTRRARRWWRSSAVAGRALEESFRRAPFELAHVHSGLHFGRGALAARRRLRARFPIAVHHHHLEGNLIERTLEAAACRAADLVVAPSRFAARALEQAGGPPASRVAVIPRGVEPPAWIRAGAAARTPDPPASGPPGRRLILSVGRLVARKRPLLLIEALAEIERAQPGLVRLRLIGDGPLEGALRARALALGVERWVELSGRCSDAEKWRTLSGCAVFATASSLEGFGLAAAEAMAAGVPVVAPRLASFPELIEDGVNGALVTPADSGALATAILALIREPRRAREWGAAAARRAAAEFSWDAAASRLRELYEDARLRAREAA